MSFVVSITIYRKGEQIIASTSVSDNGTGDAAIDSNAPFKTWLYLKTHQLRDIGPPVVNIT